MPLFQCTGCKIFVDEPTGTFCPQPPFLCYKCWKKQALAGDLDHKFAQGRLGLTAEQAGAELCRLHNLFSCSDCSTARFSEYDEGCRCNGKMRKGGWWVKLLPNPALIFFCLVISGWMVSSHLKSNEQVGAGNWSFFIFSAIFAAISVWLTIYYHKKKAVADLYIKELRKAAERPDLAHLFKNSIARETAR
ncbi:MAG: hypothetical protein JWL69_3967 [Phycisphaerales bacterium]|nr:hypothetical protein [Phycisphaerales bacterium]